MAPNRTVEDLPIDHEFRDASGVRLHVVAAGNPADPLVVLLHGFPEFWYGWHRYIEPLVEAGYRVLVPDQRGYNRSGKPAGVRPYRITELTRDIVALIRSDGYESAHVVGHDWGAMVAWNLALREPQRVDRLGVVNVPHPTAFRRTLLGNREQLRRSWYAFAFQIPLLPEWTAARNDFALWTRVLTESVPAGTFDEADLDRYRTAWGRPRAARSMVNWYRAVPRYPRLPPRESVEAPTLIVWGERDEALVPELAPRSLSYCENGRLERFPDAGHFVTHERPDNVAELLVDHLGG
ncbi:alpha/beta fold hydrolase [Halobaculum sp. WSA2]|uniref:Alpha/beta fold hydrolase n=1 Tax=Halobaculum saliterrae TaxID=2073113 RepID=A0A6B0SX20_9EURY|nr:alpha/beta hydrolase [Halobaculum saliterrae]MXR40812.1 alpha/beta fold hydrolase [Halobaculum saliterrae]